MLFLIICFFPDDEDSAPPPNRAELMTLLAAPVPPLLVLADDDDDDEDTTGISFLLLVVVVAERVTGTPSGPSGSVTDRTPATKPSTIERPISIPMHIAAANSAHVALRLPLPLNEGVAGAASSRVGGFLDAAAAAADLARSSSVTLKTKASPAANPLGTLTDTCTPLALARTAWPPRTPGGTTTRKCISR